MTQINKIRNERGEITTDTKEIQKIIKKIMNNYMPTNWTTWTKLKIPRNIQSSKNKYRIIENLNRHITSNGIEAVIQKLPTNTSPGPDDFTGEFYQTFQEELTLLILKLFKKFKRREVSQAHFMRSALS